MTKPFEVNRRRYGGFLLLVQTPEWEFLTAVDNEEGAIIGRIQANGATDSPQPTPS